jgi:hypothetical protein
VIAARKRLDLSFKLLDFFEGVWLASEFEGPVSGDFEPMKFAWSAVFAQFAESRVVN